MSLEVLCSTRQAVPFYKPFPFTYQTAPAFWAMVLLNEEMIAMGVKIHATWRRYPHYNIEYIVPNDEESVKAFCRIVSNWYPGEQEFCGPGESVKECVFKTARDPRWARDQSTQIIKVECYYNE